MKKYKFNNEVYTDLESLSQAFINNFDIAVEEIFIKPRKLVSFIKSFDKQKAKKIVDIFESTKYKGNVVSFIIFTISKDPIVLVNGVNLDFNNFIKVIGINKENKAIKAFMEDHGMSRTYATMDIDKKIPNDSYYIEKTFDDDFTYNYLANYLRVDYTENLNGFISNILINDDERFRRACEVVLSDDFQMVLAHKANFKAAYNIRYSQDPIFEAIKMLSFEYNKADLLKIIDDTFYWWLLDNYDKYIYYKKETLALKTRLAKIKKACQKELTFEERISYAKELYEIYLLFAEGYAKKEIGVNIKKYNLDQYALDKHYCKTLISVDFMKNHPVRLSTDEEIKALEKENALKLAKEAKELGEELPKEEIAGNEEIAIEVIKDERPNEKQLKLANKRTKKVKSLTKSILTLSILLGILLALICFVIPLLPETIFNFSIKKFIDNYNSNQDKITLFTYASFGVILTNIILMFVITFRNAKSQKAYDLYYKHESISKKETNLSTQDQKDLRYIEKNYSKICKRIKRTERIITGVYLALSGALYSAFVIVIFYVYKSSLEDLKVYLALGGSFGFGLLLGLLFKKKGVFSALLVFIVSIGLTAALLII